MSSESTKQWDADHVWHAFTQMEEYEPFIIERAEGTWLIDIDGNRFLDGVSSLWCNVHGHNHPYLSSAIKTQLDRVAHVTSLGSSNDTTIRLARKLAELAPGDLSHVFFSSDGASAVEVGLKMAFQYWRQIEKPQTERNKYIALGSAYHGDTLGSVSIGGVARFHSMFKPLLFDVVRVPSPNCFRLPEEVRPENATDFYLKQYESVIRSHAESTAALVIEPMVQGAAGMVVHPPGLLAGVRELTRRYDILMIADEVAVGMGRTGKMFACEHENVEPDILCLGKGLSGGYLPLAATLANHRIYQAFLGDYASSRTLYHGHTFSGNPVCCAAGLANLEIFENEKTLTVVNEKSNWLRDGLDAMGDHKNVGDVRSCGMIGAIELVKDKKSNEPFDLGEKRGLNVCRFALEKGVWLRPLGNVLVVMPPFCVQKEEIDLLLNAIRFGIEQEFGN